MQINKSHCLSLFAQWMRRDKNARSEMALSNISHAWTLKTRRYTWVFFKLTWAESTLCDWRVHQKSKLCTWIFFKVISVLVWFFCIFFLHDYNLLASVFETAKHTFSLDNFKISWICDQGREQFFFWQWSPLFSLLWTQLNSLGISFDITRQFLMRLEFSSLTLLSRLFFSTKWT